MVDFCPGCFKKNRVMKIKTPVVYLFFFLAILNLGNCEASHYHVYLIGGQSNANGRGDAAKLTDPYAGSQEDVLFYWHRSQKTQNVGHLQEDQWIHLAPGSGHGQTSPVYPREFGLELSLGRTLANENSQKKIAIIKYSHGGSNLHTQWGKNGSKYRLFLNTARMALESLKEDGHTFEISGVVWQQGEADAGSLKNARLYRENLTSLIARVRRDLANSRLVPFSIGGLSDSQNRNVTTPGHAWQIVRTAQESVAKVIPQVGFVDTDGLPTRIGEPIHFNHQGQMKLGVSHALELIRQNEDVGKIPSKPNIVFIMADDLGWADVDFHNGFVETPNLRRLRSQGMELTQHYVAPVCSPTRLGLLTGRYWSRFGVTTPTNTLALPTTTVTLAEVLGTAGYQTCLTGKWHLGSEPQWGPNHFGFQHSYGSLAGGVTPWSHFYKKGPYSKTWHRNEKLITEKGHVTDLITKEAITWLENKKNNQPFFLYVPFTAVHLPLREPESWLSRVPKQISGKVRRQYAAAVLHLDDAVGRILTAVDKLDKSENTFIVVTSDNGGSTAENNDTKYPDDLCPAGKLPGSNLPLRGKKGDLYEGGTRVPTIVRWKGEISPGSKNNTPVHIVDWMPTFCRLSGSTADAKNLKFDGVDLWPVFSGTRTLEDRPLYSAGTGFRSSTLRKGPWKLLLHWGRKSTDEVRVELYHIGDDSSEARNLASLHPGKVVELKKDLFELSRQDRDAQVKSERR